MDFLTAHATDLLFYLFAALATISALGVVTMRNPMYGAISLLTSFLAIAGLFFLRSAEFLGVVQIFVYGGGIMVLFLFVIMLINLQQLYETRLFGQGSGAAVLVAVGLFLLVIFVFYNTDFGPANPHPEALVSVDGEVQGNSQAVSWILYTKYLLPFEVASVFLLVAMIGAVVLGRRD